MKLTKSFIIVRVKLIIKRLYITFTLLKFTETELEENSIIMDH